MNNKRKRKKKTILKFQKKKKKKKENVENYMENGSYQNKGKGLLPKLKTP
jgi:hypothetical protein